MNKSKEIVMFSIYAVARCVTFISLGYLVNRIVRDSVSAAHIIVPVVSAIVLALSYESYVRIRDGRQGIIKAVCARVSRKETIGPVDYNSEEYQRILEIKRGRWER